MEETSGHREERLYDYQNYISLKLLNYNQVRIKARGNLQKWGGGH